MTSRSMSAPGIPVPNIRSNLGFLLMGLTLSSILYGVSGLQVFIYSQSGKKDGVLIKSIVWTVWILDTFHQALVIYCMYWLFILNSDDIFVLKSITWTLPATNFCVTAIFVLVNSFFIIRLWKLSKNRILIMTVVVLMVAAAGMSIAWTIMALPLPLDDIFKLRHLLWAIATVVATTDLVIAISLSYYLHDKRSGFRALHSMVNKLIAYTVTTGLVSFISTLCFLITDLARPYDFYFIMFHFIIGKLYTNSLLASLNYRDKIRAIREVDQINTVSFVAPSVRRKFRSTLSSTAKLGNDEPEQPCIILVSRTVDTVYDEDFITRDVEHTSAQMALGENDVSELKVSNGEVGAIP